MPPSTLILRADASIAMGTGHLMRCLALAQAWQDQGGECIFAMAESTASAEERIRREKFEVVTLAESPGSPQDAAQIGRTRAGTSGRLGSVGWLPVRR